MYKNEPLDNKTKPLTRDELETMIYAGEDISNANVSQITDMSNLFNGVGLNYDISKWDVSNVTNMSKMLYYCREFDQDISNWDVSNVTDMSEMFYYCEEFNQDLSNWNVSRVQDMSHMFSYSKSFNQNISNWDVSSVKNKNDMFKKCKSFNKAYNPFIIVNTKTIKEEIEEFGEKYIEEQSCIIVHDIASMKKENRITLANFVKYALNNGKDIPILYLNPSKYEDEINNILGQIDFIVYINKGTVERKIAIDDDFFEKNSVLISQLAELFTDKNSKNKITDYSEEDGI